MTRPDTSDYRALFLSGAPMIDLRAPVEFDRGAFPGVLSLPLMDDDERHQVGTVYKQQGQQAAIELGHRLVSGKTKSSRLAAWADFARAHPDGYLYCFRGGLRSRTVQRWLREEAGIDYPLVVGGYKAMRTFLLDTLEAAVAECRFTVLGGLTGTGKTEVIAALSHGIDLEGLARHRGSTFGRRVEAQPAQIDFENALAIDLLRRRAAGMDTFVLEDESRLIGRCALPHSLHQGMKRWPVVWLDDSFGERVDRILRDYVTDLHAEHVARFGPEEGAARHAQQLLDGLDRLARRLGAERLQHLRACMVSALAEQQRSGSVQLHRAWIEVLLREYYDPMYAHQRAEKADRIVFSGPREPVLAYLSSASFPHA
jgi:tRNA 2-selenouridine synthase